MHLAKFVHSATGKYIMSAILGFGLASLFRTVCKDKNCILFYAPPLDEVEDKIYKQDNKCYTFKTSSVRCHPNKKSISVQQ